MLPLEDEISFNEEMRKDALQWKTRHEVWEMRHVVWEMTHIEWGCSVCGMCVGRKGKKRKKRLVWVYWVCVESKIKDFKFL